jgi:hypothetical protein
VCRAGARWLSGVDEVVGVHIRGARKGERVELNPQNGAAGAPFRRTHSGGVHISMGGT